MFEHVSLIIKRDNKPTPPDYTWTPESHIHCNCTLDYGLGQKTIWAGTQSIPLTKLIHFYKKLTAGQYKPDDNEYSFRHGDMIVLISWGIQDNDKVLLTIKETRWNSTTVKLERMLQTYELYAFVNSFFMSVLKILLKHTTEDVCTHYGELFFGGKTFGAFKIGQRVETIVGGNVKTYRNGHIIRRDYHDKMKSHVYFLLVNEKPCTRWYMENELKSL